MTRPYSSPSRDESSARTRRRIIGSTLELLPREPDAGVDRIAAVADVSVQTLYTHFGSKRGLILAVLDAAQQDAGLYRELRRVWSSPDGETALRRMSAATMRLWHHAWPFVEFSERARRSDPEIARHLAEVDGYRRANLRSITDRLALEVRLRQGLSAERAADIAFAFTLPSVYQEIVRVRAWPIRAATDTITESVVSALVEPGSPSRVTTPADWSDVLLPGSALEP